MRRAIQQLTHECDNRCLFCAQAGAAGASAKATPASLVELRREHDEITFVGGEPTLAPTLPEQIAEAHALGFRAIGLQTNARRLASDTELLGQLHRRGLSDLHLSLLAPTAPGHDYHSGQPGSFDACLTLMEGAQRLGLRVVVSTTITRSNYHELPQVPAQLKRRGVAGWLLEWPRPFGRAADEFGRVIPRLGMAVPWALHAIKRARSYDLPTWIRGVPLCLLGPYADTALPIPARSFAGACSGCAARAHCGGIDEGYLSVFDAKEFVPRAPPGPAQPSSAHVQILAMFVGIGELVAREPTLYTLVTPPGSPRERKNHRLPLLADSSDDESGSKDVEPR